jgi:hypothetical protein
LQFQRDDAGFYAKAAIVRRSCAEISRFAIKIPFIAAYEAAAHPGLCRSKHSALIFRNLRFRFNVQLGKGSYLPSERAPYQGARHVASVSYESLVARVAGIGLLDLLQDLAEVVALGRLQRREFFVAR